MSALPSWAVPGRKVVCVDDRWAPLMGMALVHKETYTLESGAFFDPIGNLAVVLREVKSDHPNGGYRLARFRPIVTLEEDMLTFTSLLNTVPAINTAKELTE